MQTEHFLLKVSLTCKGTFPNSKFSGKPTSLQPPVSFCSLQMQDAYDAKGACFGLSGGHFCCLSCCGFRHLGLSEGVRWVWESPILQRRVLCRRFTEASREVVDITPPNSCLPTLFWPLIWVFVRSSFRSIPGIRKSRLR